MNRNRTEAAEAGQAVDTSSLGARYMETGRRPHILTRVAKEARDAEAALAAVKEDCQRAREKAENELLECQLKSGLCQEQMKKPSTKMQKVKGLMSRDKDVKGESDPGNIQFANQEARDLARQVHDLKETLQHEKDRARTAELAAVMASDDNKELKKVALAGLSPTSRLAAVEKINEKIERRQINRRRFDAAAARVDRMRIVPAHKEVLSGQTSAQTSADDTKIVDQVTKRVPWSKIRAGTDKKEVDTSPAAAEILDVGGMAAVNPKRTVAARLGVGQGGWSEYEQIARDTSEITKALGAGATPEEVKDMKAKQKAAREAKRVELDDPSWRVASTYDQAQAREAAARVAAARAEGGGGRRRYKSKKRIRTRKKLSRRLHKQRNKRKTRKSKTRRKTRKQTRRRQTRRH
jgi:hypothetical protein